jgi:hypothetical protein
MPKIFLWEAQQQGYLNCDRRESKKAPGPEARGLRRGIPGWNKRVSKSQKEQLSLEERMPT